MGMRSEVIDMLAAKKVDDATRQLVVAAWLGPDMVDKVLSGEQADPVTDPAETDKGQVPSVYLESLTVNGFRGIGPEATLQLNPQPGLTVVVGRNGSGKSSFSMLLRYCSPMTATAGRASRKYGKEGGETSIKPPDRGSWHASKWKA